ncbi:hypothetical protein M8J77_001424 [Diaphorina citri]|nr:hypothetical protein M8J77_001424 [Diaphorina citri]
MKEKSGVESLSLRMEAKKTIQTAGKELDEDILNLGNGVGGTALGDSGQLTRLAHDKLGTMCGQCEHIPGEARA